MKDEKETSHQADHHAGRDRPKCPAAVRCDAGGNIRQDGLGRIRPGQGADADAGRDWSGKAAADLAGGKRKRIVRLNSRKE